MKFRTENRFLTMFSFSSLTGIVLLLLIFFLLSSSLVPRSGIKVELPRAEAAEATGEHGVTITLTMKGRIFVNARAVTQKTLGQTLTAALGKNTEQVIVINADRNVSLQSTVRVMDVAKGVGASRFIIATQQTVD